MQVRSKPSTVSLSVWRPGSRLVSCERGSPVRHPMVYKERTNEMINVDILVRIL